MSQADLGTLDPQTTDGPELADLLKAWRTALHSCHKGPTRPAYAIVGTMWIDDSSSPWVVNIFDGSEDAELGTIDPVAHTFAVGVPDGSITNAKLAEMASGAFMMRFSPGPGPPEHGTPALATAALLTMAGDAGSGGSKGLVPAPGAGDAAANRFLNAAGLWALPTGIVQLATFTHSVNVAEVVFNNIPSGYSAYLIVFAGVTGTASANFLMRVSENNGSSFLATGYGGVLSDSTDGILPTSLAQFDLALSIAAASSFTGFAFLLGPTGPNTRKGLFSAVTETHTGQYVACAAINALRLFWSTGNIDGGSIHLCGVR